MGNKAHMTLRFTCFVMQCMLCISCHIYTILYTYVIPEPSVFYLVCVSAAEERHGCRFRRGSAEETARGRGLVQPSPLPIHLHPGPGSQDPRPAPTAQKLKQTHTSTKTGQGPNFSVSYWIEASTKHKDEQLQKIPIEHSFLFLAALLLFTDSFQLLSSAVGC